MWFKMSKKKRYTLAAFGFTKSISHRGEETAVDIPKVVSYEKPKLNCQHCIQEFINQQGLSVHLMCKHAATAGDQSHSTDQPLSTSQNGKSLSIVSAAISEEEIEQFEISEPPVEKRRGRDLRKSITNRFKAKAIAAVEEGEKHIDVAERLNVNMSQISKWLKMKDKIAVDENKKLFRIKPAEK